MMNNRPLLYDIFCGAGGATKGYQMAGFRVTGVDIKSQPHYCGDEFIQMDAFEFFDKYRQGHFEKGVAFSASPPCQAHSALKTMWNAKPHQDLIATTRKTLIATGKPYIIENVPGAPMFNAFILCGTMFGLGTGDAELRRHRLFECSFALFGIPECRHYARARVVGVYGGHGRDRRRIKPSTVAVYGHAGGTSVRDGTQQFSTAQRKEAMGIDWMTGNELSQAIPPAYCEYIGKQLIRYLAGKVTAKE